MSKKLHSKLLSVILCIAICCATLCGSIIAVNAAAADYNGTYTITVGDEKNAVPFAATEVKAQVKFDLPAGFVGGQFTANAQDTYTIGDTATIVAATDADGNELTTDEISKKTEVTDEEEIPAFSVATKDNGSNKRIRFVLDGTYKSITIEYTLMIIDNASTADIVDDYVSNGTTTKYPVTITLDEDDLVQFATYDLQDVTFTASAESDSFFHSHSSWYGTNGLVLDAEKNGKHTVTLGNARCHWCTTSVANGGLGLAMNDNYIPQVLPDYTEFDGVTTPVIADGDTDGDAHTAWIGISGVTVSYNDDGTLDVDVHAYSQYRTGNNDKVVILVCDTEGNELYRLPAVANGTSYLAGNGFPTAEKMFTITGLSARDIDTQLLLTAVEYSAGAIEHSRTMPFCLADYCQNVVEGNSAIWVDGATSEQIEADKDVAAALYYYGAAIDESVFDKNTVGGGSSSSNIEYVNKSVASWKDTTNYNNNPFASWDAFIASGVTGNGEEATPYIISTAEQLHYVSTTASEADTKNKFFKVADNIAAFDFMSSSVANKNDSSTYRFSKEGGVFAGTFDGNGAVVRNLYKKGNFPGLFTKLGAGATVKNISVDSSAFVSTGGQYAKGAGAIFGAVTGSWSGDSIYIENCKVTNCYMAALEQTMLSATFGAGVIGGYAHAFNVNINNCFVAGNTVESPANGSIGGLIATGYSYNSNVSNSIVLGTAPFAKWNAGINLETCNYQHFNHAKYTNVYTDQPIANCYKDQANATLRTFTDAELKVVSIGEIKGKGAVDELKLDSSIWFDSAEYPELSIFHKLAKTPVDENTHKEICVIKAGSATCSFKGLTENHTFLENDEGTLLVCECGYSKEIIGNTVTPNNKIKVTYGGSRPTTFAESGITGEGTTDKPYIISTPAQLFYISQHAGAETVGNYYKVADNVAVFDMNNSYWGLADNSKYFQGTFDGNGVEIVNFTTSGYHGALFPNVGGNVTIKNLKVTGAVVSSSSGQAGGIYGNVQGGSAITINNCVITDCTISTTSNGCIGSIGGVTSNAILTVENCFIANNGNNAAGTGNINTIGYPNNSGHTMTNTIVIGDIVHSNFTNKTNVHTSAQTGVGAVAAMNLGDAWFDTASYPELHVFHDMIDIYVDENTHKSVCQIFVNGTQCTTCETTEEHTLIKNSEGTANVCSCGYEEEINGNTLTPNNVTEVISKKSVGTSLSDTVHQGTSWDDAIIISTPEEFAYLAKGADGTTEGKYYKIKDGIKFFNMQGMTDISLSSTADQVKTAGKAISDAGTWSYYNGVCNNNSSTHFRGHFDGNGITIYNIYGKSWGMALFPCIGLNSEIKNVTVASSYFEAQKGAYTLGAGGIFGSTVGSSTSNRSNISISNCAVKNCYIYAGQRDNGAAVATGSIGGDGGYNNLILNDCIGYDNILENPNTKASVGGLIAISYASEHMFTNCISLGQLPYPTGTDGVANLGSANCYNNVYTDQVIDTSKYTNAQIKSLSVDNFKGIGVVKNLNLDSDIWFDTNSYPELSVFHDMATIYIDANTHQTVCQHFINGTQCTTTAPAESHNMIDAEDGKSASCECGYSYEIKGIHAMNLPESILNRITSNSVYTEKFATNALFKEGYNEDVFGTQTEENVFDMYTTSLNLKVNPHIGFMFAFHDEYKTYRSNITVTFTVDGETYTTEAVETSGTLGTNWVNNKGAGRYHLYRFKELPVSKLCKDVQVTVNYNGSAYDFGTYSAAGYAINAMNAGEDYMYHVNASMALVYYSEMLAARAGA